MSKNEDSLRALIEELSKDYPAVHLLKILAAKTEGEFEETLEVFFEMAIRHVEKNANHLSNCGEEAISAFIVAFLSGSGLLRATQEAHSNGHVDITIESIPGPQVFEKLCEAKIYRGPKYHVKAMKQLIDRYSTGRDSSGAIFEYVKMPQIKNLVEKIRKHLDRNKPCGQDGDSEEHRIRWAFSTKHLHSSGEPVRILHLNCNLHRP